MVRTLKVFALFALAVCALEISAAGGDKEVLPPERKEFHMSPLYPYVFRPVVYLQAQEPVAMRYGAPAIDLIDRDAPPLPKSAKGVDEAKKNEEKAAASPSPQAQASPAPKNSSDARILTESGPVYPPLPENPEPAYPVPENAPTPIPKGSADFNKAPDEVDGYFRNQYNFVPDSHRFFDPIFEPAEAPQQAQIGPKSTSTYSETH
jgi:hypothetical protein